MPKKQTKPQKQTEYPNELLVAVEIIERSPFYTAYASGLEAIEEEKSEVAIYKFDRLAKVKRTVTVE